MPPHPSTSDRVRLLLEGLSLEEKVAQLCCLDASEVVTADGLELDRLASLLPHGIGHVSSSGALGSTAEQMRSEVARFRDAASALSPHGVPPLMHAEALNGLVHQCGSQFPSPIGLAATFDPEVVEAMTDVTRREMRDLGIPLALSPVLDLARDARWARVQESYGEDPTLVAEMAVAFVSGLAGEDLRTGVAATAKHFLGYGASQSGLNHAVETVGPRALRDEYARPFEAAIRRAGLLSVMNSYSEIDGIPVAADPAILTDLLRGELGFDGIVVSDYFSVTMIKSLHGVAADDAEAGRLGLTAGVDVEFPRPTSFGTLVESVRAGLLDESIVDRAVARVLDLKERLGLLDDIVPAPEVTQDDRREAESIADRAAAEALTLLTNPGILPLQLGRLASVAVIGELAGSARIHFGAYSAPAVAEFGLGGHGEVFSTAAGYEYIGSVLHRWREPVPDELTQFERTARELHPRTGDVATALRERLDGVRIIESLRGGPEGTDTGALDAAESAAADADAAIVVIGERNGWIGALPTSGEGRDRSTLDIPGDQTRLALRVAATGVPTIVVLVSGRPLEVGELVAAGVAIVHAPLLASSGPAVIADALLGRFSPSGRAAITWPRTAGQSPLHAGSHTGSGYSHPRLVVPGYIDGPAGPQFAFGHGLSYARFEYSSLRTPESVSVDGAIVAEIDVMNTSEVDSDEVVQVYGYDPVASVTRPLQQLVAFRRVHVPAGRSARLRFTLPLDLFSFTGRDARLRVEPGVLELSAGGSSDRLPARAQIRVTGEPRHVEPAVRRMSFDVEAEVR